MKEKITEFLVSVFIAGITVCIGLGLFVAIGFSSAILIGGDFAVTICAFMEVYVLPLLYVFGGVIAIVGIVKMYLCNEKTFVLELRNKKEKTHANRASG